MRTSILRMDSSLLYQLSYPGVVPEVYVGAEPIASRPFGRVRLSRGDMADGAYADRQLELFGGA